MGLLHLYLTLAKNRARLTNLLDFAQKLAKRKGIFSLSFRNTYLNDFYMLDWLIYCPANAKKRKVMYTS